jgi:hypothetical protein
MRSGSGAGTFFAATYLLNAATLKPSFFAACRIENELIGNIVPDNILCVKWSDTIRLESSTLIWFKNLHQLYRTGQSERWDRDCPLIGVRPGMKLNELFAWQREEAKCSEFHSQ